MVKRGRKPRAEKKIRFDQKLVLNQWMLSLFDVPTFERLAEDLRSPELEGWDENNVSRYYHALRARLFDREELPFDVLLAYDENIVRHWTAITEHRNQMGYILHPKYFQYLSLLFAEIYLDRYFRDPDNLLSDLNAHVEAFNEGRTMAQQSSKLFEDGVPKGSQIEPYGPQDLNKVGLWSATGSGKTLLMHVNILQYKHYLALHSRERELNQTILLTPNEGLSHQHLDEFNLSRMDAEIFSKEGRSLFSGRCVEIIDIHKLREETGEKTVAVDAFEGNNLVLVDEGHRGMSGAEIGHWLKMRNQLCEDGFSFEYSATFGQAMKASGMKPLEQQYSKCILFDYSYKYFYRDGYGKDYRILNLEDDSDEQVRQRYLTASLLAFYQQQKLYGKREHDFRRFLLERPLWIFVGSSVNAVRTQKGRKVSDVVDILLVLSEFIQDRAQSVEFLDRFLREQSGLLDPHGNDIFANAFPYLTKLGISPEELYDDILRVLFNANSPAVIHVENLKGTDGEIALRLADNDPFGVINVGDASSLCKLCAEHKELVVTDRDFSDSLFRGLNDSESTVNLLIGSKKFTEGWNSWRVSSMGLMNVGRSEGPLIIQLFGRGVRLRGLDFCLKRSTRIREKSPEDIELLETLNIFGVRANYMRQFKEYLEEEGLPANEDRIEFVLPVIKNLGKKKLKAIRLPDNIDFKRNGPKPALDLPDKQMKRNRVVVDWYPKIQAMASSGVRGSVDVAERKEGWFEEEHVAFMDLDEIYFEMERFKNERAWYNLNLPRDRIATLLLQRDWYRLWIPEEELEFRGFDQVRRWQEVAVALLKKYCDRYYKMCKAAYEGEHLEYYELAENDPNFIEEYRLLIKQSRDDIVAKLGELKEIIENGGLRDFEFAGFKSIMFSQHLYQPLIHVRGEVIEVRPVVLENEGERDFVLDLKEFCEKNGNFFAEKELYLLRNLSRGRGIGFFEAGNFYPDFILWLLSSGRQYVTFVDPKGLRNVDGPKDPKIQFHAKIKTLERDLGDPAITLNSFIIATTPPDQEPWWSGEMSKQDLEQCHVLFQREDKHTYTKKLLTMVCGG